MNQIKIGKFIAKCRKEKELTQQELADKLGVTDKAISKWENGRCLMDISLLKPLSECLDVSIVELINGEKIESEDVSEKSGEAIEKTLGYAKRKIKKNRTKLVIIYSLLTLVLMFFVYKGALLYFYNVPRDEIDEIVDGLVFEDTMTIYKRTIPNDEYFTIENIKLQDVFSELEMLEILNEMYPYQFVLKDDAGNSLGGIIIDDSTLTGNLIDIFVSDDLVFMGEIDSDTFPIDIGQFNNADRKDFLLQNDINNDIDFIRYISENCYAENNIFTSPKRMKENYAINLFTSIAIPEVDSVTLIDGDYSGYIYNHEKYRSVNILRNDTTYSFTFVGDDFTTDEYISNLLSTLEIK